MKTTTQKQITDTIVEQLGTKALYMIGAKKLMMLSDGGLQMRIGRNCKKVNCIVIKLNSLDLYDIIYYNVRGMKIKTISESNNIYSDMMHADIEANTGMRTSL